MPKTLSNHDFQMICANHELGEFKSATSVEGGRIHSIYKMVVIKDNQVHQFSLKVLNPLTIKTEFEKSRFVITDKIAEDFKIAAINSVSSITGNVESFGEGKNQFNYMLYKWIDGKTLSLDEIQPEHCYAIGEQLAKMHHFFLNKETAPYQNDMQGKYHFDFEAYLQKQTVSENIKIILSENIKKINEILKHYMIAISTLDKEVPVKAHGDMDSSNTIWLMDAPFFIDWEKATAAISPSKDYMITAIYWSRTSSGKFSDDNYSSFNDGYQQYFKNQNIPYPEINQNAGILALLAHWLIWVDFNLQRAFNCLLSSDEIDMAEQQVEKTLNSIFTVYEKYYNKNQEPVSKHLLNTKNNFFSPIESTTEIYLSSNGNAIYEPLVSQADLDAQLSY